MKRSIVRVLCFVAACGWALAAGSALLVRVERKGNDDLTVLRSADLPVVMEMDTCLLVRGGPEMLPWLSEHGYRTDVLDRNADASDYLIVGLRPDSDRAAVDAAGSILLEERNWALLRVAPGISPAALSAARVFTSPLLRTVVDLPKPAPSLVPARAESVTAGDPLVQKMVNTLSNSQIQQTWVDLTTNAPTGTRYGTTQGCRDAATYCLNRYTALGLPAQFQNWSASYAPNVIATQTGAVTPGNVFIVEGHLDDLPISGLAPGADDNASASVNVLEAARVMSCYAFKNTVKYLNVTGEEDGLLGSTAYANDAASRNENILGVLNMDMIGWQGDTPGSENMDLNYNAASQDLALRFVAAAGTYGTGLVVDAFLCPSLNASDHYPFWQHGWKAVCGITDNEGYCSHAGNYPYYHTSNDTIANNGNPAFFYSAVRATVATLAELAEPFKLALDRSSYSCGGDTIQLFLGDRDLNTNPATVQTVTVSIASGTEAAPESVVLTESGPNSMIFTGSIGTTTGPAVPGDGLLSVAAGDTLTAGYTDAIDCDGAANVAYTATAQTDCVAPAISGVQVSQVTGNSAVVQWATNEAATTVVHYGTTPPGALTASSAALVTGHSLMLTGLAECSSYFFWVESRDAAGNSASSDNGGAYFTFTTGKNVNPVYAYAGASVSIPDNSATGASVTVSVPDSETIVDVNVLANITHSYDGDISLSLIGPDGTTVALSTRRGGSGDNFTNTIFDDQASTAISTGTAPFTGSFKPEGLLSSFNGKVATGTWRLKVVDSASSDVGTINGFELRLSYPPRACGASLEYDSSAVAEACNGTGIGGGNAVIDPGETVTLTLNAKNNGTAPVTGVSATLTSSTPGVTVTDGSATFPDIPAGAVRTSDANHFTFVVAPALSCGSSLDFTVSFTSNEGAWSDTFSLTTGTPGQGSHTYVSTNVPRTVTDNATVASTLTVADTGAVTDVNVTLSLTHTWDGDVALTLVSPSGTRVTLSSRHGGSGDNYANTTFDDQAATAITAGTPPYTGAFKPDGALSALNGVQSSGTWQLEVQDTGTGDTGTLTAWSLQLTAAAPPTCQSCAPSLAGEATGLRWIGAGKDDLAWDAAANATGYEVVRGELTDLPALQSAVADSCSRMSTGALDTGAALTETPPGGSFYWYLVRAWNVSGEGPAGNGSAGPRQQESMGACP